MCVTIQTDCSVSLSSFITSMTSRLSYRRHHAASAAHFLPLFPYRVAGEGLALCRFRFISRKWSHKSSQIYICSVGHWRGGHVHGWGVYIVSLEPSCPPPGVLDPLPTRCIHRALGQPSHRRHTPVWVSHNSGPRQRAGRGCVSRSSLSILMSSATRGQLSPQRAARL